MHSPRRDFIFIDEHGDPGPPVTGSSHFASIALHTTDVSLQRLVECFADLRFYRQLYSETKNLDSNPALRPKLVEILRHLSAAHDVHFSVTFREKSRYTGPYMDPVDGIRFRNFQVRRLLEWHFSRHTVVTSECEVVFDRHSHSASQLDNLRTYLKDNYRLPTFTGLTAVDSRYVELIQVADLALRIWRRKELSRNPNYGTLDLSFVASRDISAMSRNWKP